MSVSGGSVGSSLVGIEVDNNDVNFSSTAASTVVDITGVSISSVNTGVLVLQDSSGGAVTATISNVTVDDPDVGIEIDGGSAVIQNSQIQAATVGIEILSVTNAGGVTMTNNTIDNADIGVYAWNSSGPLSITGGTIENAHDTFGLGQGILLINTDFAQPPASQEATVDESMSISGVSFIGDDTGISVDDFAGTFGHPAPRSVSVAISGGTTISGGGVGLIVDGPNASVVGNTINDTSFSGQSDSYIQLFDGALGGPVQLDATGATFDGFLAGTAAVNSGTLPTFFAIEDKINDYLDESTEGYVKLQSGYDFLAHSSEASLPSNSNHSSPGSVQRLVNASGAGDNAYIQAGVYVEQVVITKDLTLEGTDEATTIIRSPASVPANFITTYNGVENHPIVFVSNADVTMEDLTVDGAGQASGNFRFEGVGYYDATGTIDHVTVEHIRDNPLDGVQTGVGIFAQNDDAAARNLNVTDDTIFDYQKGGIVINGAGLNALVSGNTVTGSGPTSLIAQNGIQISRGAVADVTGNIIDGNSYTPAATPGDYAVGVLLFQAGGGTVVSANTIGATSGSDAGIYLDGTGGMMTIADDTIKNSEHAGIYFADDAGGTTVSENFIQNNAAGIIVDASATNVGAIQDNSITGNATAGIDNESGVTVDATSNWWGTANGPTNPANTYNVGHQGDKIIGPGTTNFVPWLNDGTDYSGDPGFQPHNTTFAPVTNDLGGLFSSIQAGVDGTPAGHTVTAAAGTFTENVNVDQSLTIAGAGQGLTTVYSATSNPLGSGPGSLNGGSVIFLVAADNVTIHDLTVDGDNPQIGPGINAPMGSSRTTLSASSTT